VGASPLAITSEDAPQEKSIEARHNNPLQDKSMGAMRYLGNGFTAVITNALRVGSTVFLGMFVVVVCIEKSSN
jgi:hypothetical protein